MAIRLSGMVSGLDTDSIVQELVSAYSTKKDNYEKDQTKLSWTMDAWKDMNTKIYSFYTDSLSDMRYGSTFLDMKTTTVSDETKATVTANSSVTNGTQTLEITQLATAGYLTGDKLSESATITGNTTLGSLGITGSQALKLTVGGTAKTVNISETMTVSQFTSAVKAQGLNATFDTTQQRFIISSKESGTVNEFNFDEADASTLSALTKLGLSTTDGAYKQDATNSIIKVNGATFETSSNTLVVNGLTINAKGATNGVITMTTGTDVDGIYKMVKNFFTKYNELVNSMDTAYNADSIKGYAPLTDDEKESMTESEIDKWEEKIKGALLRRDSTLESVSSLFKTDLQKSYDVNGKEYNLSSFGINTLGYFISAENEKNAFHINGDKEDSSTSINADKLRAAIESDPESVSSFFTQLTTGLYDDLTKRMKSTSLNSAYKVYNDKKFQADYDDYDDKIDDWEDKIKDMEDYYYKKFSDMETALSSLQSSTNSLTSLLGTS